MKAVQYRRFRDEVVAHFEAMGAARRSEIDRVEEALRNGVSVILTGHAGIGKSYVAAELISRLEPGARSSTSDSVIRCSRSRDVERLRDLAASASDSTGVLTVEDAHLLGADDLRALSDVVSNSNRPVLITMDLLQVDMLSRESLDRSKLITSLWSTLGLDRVDLSGIGYNEAASIIDSVSDGRGVDAVTRARIVHGAAGNPQLVVELTREAMLTPGGYGIDIASLVIGPITLSARILDLTRECIASLSDVDEYALVTLAKVGAVPYVRATRLVGQAPLRSLLRRGLVHHEPDSVEFVAASLLYANAAQAGRDTENPLEAEHTVERILIAELQAGERLSSNECVILATYWLNNPLANSLTNPLAGLPPEAAATVFARAARRVDMWGLPASAEPFARRSLSIWPTVIGLEQLSRALAGQGMHTAAIELLENERLEHTDPFADSDLISWWSMLLEAHGFRADRLETLQSRVAAWGTFRGRIAALDDFLAARHLLLSSDYTAGYDQLETIARDESLSFALRLRALVEVIPAYTFLGMPVALEAAFNLGSEIVGELAMIRQGISTDTRVAAAMFLAECGLAKAVLGIDRAGAASDLDGYALRAVLIGNDFDLALVNMVSGALSLAAQQNARAETELAQAEAGISRKIEPRTIVGVRLLRGCALAAMGRTAEAREVLASVEHADIIHNPWGDFYKEYLSIAVQVDVTDLAPTKEAFLRLARFKNGGSRAISTMALYGAFAAGATPAAVLAVMDEIESPGESLLADVVEELLRAELAQDGFRLDAVGERFVEMALPEQASAAFHSAASAHLAAGRSTEASASYARRDTQRPAPAEKPKPASQPSVSRENIARLTRRELEIAQLAGLGLSNSEIATRLFLSVRTVESHVLQARVKLGAGRRSELGLYLAEFDHRAS